MTFVSTCVCMYEICVSFEFRPIDDELIEVVNKLTDVDTGRPDAVFIAINVNGVSFHDWHLSINAIVVAR